jgi:hypothetical protein
MFISRRNFLRLSIANVYVQPVIGGLSPLFGADSGIALTDQGGLTPEGWMSRWMEVASRQPGASLYLSRFRDPIYFLLREISWSPNPDQASSFQSVLVPKGFVTDLASIPRVFWSLLRPDGEYAYSAIIHDYMYWMQNTSRETSDQVFRLGMQDFDIDSATVLTIYEAVRLGGKAAWEENKRLREAGERRILKEFPKDPRILWNDWKERPGVFEL